MSAENAAEVTVGGRSFRIARFRGLKAQMILRLSAKIGRKYPKLATQVAEFEQAYIDENKIRLSRTEAELKFGAQAAEISDEAWETSKGELALKQMPSPVERLAAIWPELFDAAEDPLCDLLAVIALSNEELAEADDGDCVAEKIKERRRELFHDGEFEELVDLALAGYEVARGQFAPLVERAIPLLSMVGLTMAGPEETTSTTSPDPEEPSRSSRTSDDSETSPSSSTDSQPPTDGTGDRSSTAPPGPPSEPSPSD